MIERRKPLKRSSPPRRSTTPTRKTRPKSVNRTRKQSEFVRCYHSVERVEWMREQPCIAGSLACHGPIENAHVETDGMGRKASFDRIVPLCKYHHAQYDQRQPPYTKGRLREYIEETAAVIQARWESHCARVSQERTPE